MLNSEVDRIDLGWATPELSIVWNSAPKRLTLNNQLNRVDRGPSLAHYNLNFVPLYQARVPEADG